MWTGQRKEVADVSSSEVGQCWTKHLCCFEGNLWKTAERQGRVHMIMSLSEKCNAISIGKLENSLGRLSIYGLLVYISTVMIV